MYIQKNLLPQEKPAESTLAFGKTFTDHMFVMDYSREKGWHDPKIIPYSPIELSPSTMVLHYGQAVFEGLKAFRTKNNDILLFRPEKNIDRMNFSSERLCIPQLDTVQVLDAIKDLVKIDKDWVPSHEGTSLYVRPFIIATDSYIGVRPSDTYKFMIIQSPVGAYYKEGLNPVKIYTETKYVRSVKGGVGNVKTAGNYAASLKSQCEAQEKGYAQVLWLDGFNRNYIEEVGTMNVFFVIDGEIITPPTSEGTILGGVTRDSAINLFKHWEMKITERKLSIDEVFEAHKNNKLQEAFGTGTAAVVSPIGELICDDKSIIINNNQIGSISSKLYETLTNLQYGEIDDFMGWTVKV